jgi:hypothetical protein
MKICRLLQRYILVVFLSYPVTKAEAMLPNDSVDTYSNHTITDSVYVQGRTTLTISDVSVSTCGHLVASSPECIVVTGGLEVELGGKLNLYEKLVKRILFTYDASGNIIRRKEKWQAR